MVNEHEWTHIAAMVTINHNSTANSYLVTAAIRWEMMNYGEWSRVTANSYGVVLVKYSESKECQLCQLLVAVLMLSKCNLWLSITTGKILVKVMVTDVYGGG